MSRNEWNGGFCLLGRKIRRQRCVVSKGSRSNGIGHPSGLSFRFCLGSSSVQFNGENTAEKSGGHLREALKAAHAFFFF